jgi:hypothetical protein
MAQLGSSGQRVWKIEGGKIYRLEGRFMRINGQWYKNGELVNYVVIAVTRWQVIVIEIKGLEKEHNMAQDMIEIQAITHEIVRRWKAGQYGQLSGRECKQLIDLYVEGNLEGGLEVKLSNLDSFVHRSAVVNGAFDAPLI